MNDLKSISHLREVIYEMRERNIDILIYNLEDTSQFMLGYRKGVIQAYSELMDDILGLMKYHDCKSEDGCFICRE